VAAAKSTKSVAVPDAQIVAVLCPLPGTMSLNCIYCCIAPQGPDLEHDEKLILGFSGKHVAVLA
jgi:hypothetical protein